MQTHAHTRLHLLDSLRGLALLNMLAYHALYDVVYIFGHPMGWYQGWPGYLWQRCICWCFILLSGFCAGMSRRPVRRGLIVLGAGCVVSLVTALAMPEQRVRFGVLSLLGCCMLLTALCRPVLERLRPLAGLFASFAVFWITKCVPGGGLGLGDRLLTPLPGWLYSTDFLYPLGFPGPGFFSSDYFPLLPWLFLFWTGWFAYRLWERPQDCKAMQLRLPGLAWLGRHSLWAYLAHQPVVYGLLCAAAALGWV